VALFPRAFIDELQLKADIVQVVQEYVSLKKSGSRYKGLCPFHGEKTPSFSVDREKGFFYCFGCHAGGDVFKFLELQEKLGFQDAVRHLAQKFGLKIPELEGSGDSDAAERESLLKVHERAAAYFKAQLVSPAGTRVRQYLHDRGLSAETIDELGLGFAPSGRDRLKETLVAEGLSVSLLVRSGLVIERDNGQVIDRFRGRLIIPICRDTGPILAFGGRALEADQQPKYLNSPETAIYSKGRTLYGLNLTKAHIRRLGYAVLVEGYFDVAQLLQAGIQPVVASSGTALTSQQAHLLRRFTSRVILSFDPDAAGQGAAARSCELLVAEGFDVNVAVLPAGDDPDGFVRKRGREAYQALLRSSRPYLEYLLDRTAAQYDLTTDEGRRQFLGVMLSVAARIPDPAGRDQFADRLAHKARITEEVIRAEIRKAAVSRRTELTSRELPAFGRIRQAEKGLLWALVHEPAEGLEAVADLTGEDIEGLQTGHILKEARDLQDRSPGSLPAALFERLTNAEAQVLSGAAASAQAPAPPSACVRTLRRVRFEREQAQVQQEIDRLQQLGAEAHDREINELWQRRKDLLHQIEALA
jgi:DNA primase